MQSTTVGNVVRLKILSVVSVYFFCALTLRGEQSRSAKMLQQRLNAESCANAENLFANPDYYYAPHAFWFWNGCFKRDNIRTQAKDFCKQRLNAGYVHIRSWPTPPNDIWLSQKWFELFDIALEESAKANMYVSYTCGDPSFPQGAVMRQNPQLRARSLDWKIIDVKQSAPLPDCLFAVAAKRGSDGKITELKKVEGSLMPANSSVFIFNVYSDVPSQYKNSYIDKRLFDAWRKVEHDKYEARCAKYFGNVMHTVFVDQEGQWGYKMAWSEDLAETFKKRAGYDIALALPLLIEEDAEGRWAKARWDWFDALSLCYRDSFAQPISDWAKARGMDMTCHYWEGDIYQQAMEVGDYMLMQRTSTIPGTDALFADILNKPELFNETASVAAFEGRMNMCELPGVVGWRLTPATLKDMGAAAIAWGITQTVLHGINTNPNLDRVSYPPDFYLYNPSWQTFHLWNDFMRRASFVNALGRPDVSVLIYCPLDSVWSLTGGKVFDKKVEHKGEYHADKKMSAENKYADKIFEINSVYQNAQRDMRFKRIEFLNADNHYLGQMKVEGAKFAFKKFKFDTIILPPLAAMKISTAKKILEFAEAGGRVISLGSLPEASDERGMGDEKLKKIFEKICASPNFKKCDLKDLCSLLTPSASFDKMPDGKILTTRRIVGDRVFLWVANLTGKAFQTQMSLPNFSGAASKWNCENGKIEPVSQNENATVALKMEQHEAFWLVFDPKKSPVKLPPQKEPEVIMDISNDWIISIDPEKQIQTARGYVELPYGIMTGLRIKKTLPWKALEMDGFSGTVEYKKTFVLSQVYKTEKLRVENIRHTARVLVNGKLAAERMWAPFDFDIGAFLKVGENEIIVEVSNTLLNELSVHKFHKRDLGVPTDSEKLSGIIGKVELIK